MRIVSQNRSCSVDFCHVYLFQEMCEIFVGFPDGSAKVIGQYKTIDRTERVFDEIHKAVMKSNKQPIVVYYMPKD